MKNLSILIVILFWNAFQIKAQSHEKGGKITYERVLNFEGKPDTTLFNLIFDTHFTAFFEQKHEPAEEATLKSSFDSDLKLHVKFNGSKYIVYTDFKQMKIESQVSLFREGHQKTYIVEEKIPSIQWEIKEEYKSINKFEVQKAIGEFRGRTYIAWFTNQIPVKYGPWKFSGLPGLILNITDDQNQVMFLVKEIHIPFEIDALTQQKFQFTTDAKRIPISTYLALKKAQVEEVNKLIMSKLPRGSMMQVTDVKSKDIEITFE